MGKTRDFFKKIRVTKGTFHAQMGTIKGRNVMDLTEADDIKKRLGGLQAECVLLESGAHAGHSKPVPWLDTAPKLRGVGKHGCNQAQHGDASPPPRALPETPSPAEASALLDGGACVLG